MNIKISSTISALLIKIIKKIYTLILTRSKSQHSEWNIYSKQLIKTRIDPFKIISKIITYNLKGGFFMAKNYSEESKKGTIKIFV